MNCKSHSEHWLGDGAFSLVFAAGFVRSHGGDGGSKASCGYIESGLVIKTGGFGVTTLLLLVKHKSRCRILSLEDRIANLTEPLALVPPQKVLSMEVAPHEALVKKCVESRLAFVVSLLKSELGPAGKRNHSRRLPEHSHLHLPGLVNVFAVLVPAVVAVILQICPLFVTVFLQSTFPVMSSH
mgnify:CR=1 FL=1